MVILNISENFLLFFSACGVLQGVLLAIILYLHPKTDRSVAIFLSLYIFFISAPSITLVAQYYISWHVIIFVQPFLVLIGPLLYLYIRSFKEAITLRKSWPHFILFFLFVFLNGWFYAEVGNKYPASGPVPQDVPRHPLYYIIIVTRSVQRIIYFFLAHKALTSYQRSIRHLFSETSRINLNWVRWLINGYLILVLVIIAFNLVTLKYPEYYNLWVLLIGSLVTIYVYLGAWKGISQSTLWRHASAVDGRQKIETEIAEAEKIELKHEDFQKFKSSRARLTNDKTDEIIAKIISVIEKDKLYQEPELTLQELSDQLQYPPYIISQVINEGLGKNFYDLINGYRVEEAKRLLLDTKNKNFTILSVGFEAGFNSKTTFNTVFKKITGLTPSEFRTSQKQQVPLSA